MAGEKQSKRLTWFYHFMRSNFPEATKEVSGTVLSDVSFMFSDYLDKLPEDLYKEIVPCSNVDVIMKMTAPPPFYENGYHPALVAHFHQFLEQSKSK